MLVTTPGGHGVHGLQRLSDLHLCRTRNKDAPSNRCYQALQHLTQRQPMALPTKTVMRFFGVRCSGRAGDVGARSGRVSRQSSWMAMDNREPGPAGRAGP